MTPAPLLAAFFVAQSQAAPPAARPVTPAPPPPATGPVAPVTPAPPPRPTDWPFRFTDWDYPAAAMRGEEQGLVRYRVEIGPDGRVSRCTIRSSSGSEALDTETCRIVTRRARFIPAGDSDGHPVSDARDGEVTWRLPDE